MGRNHFTELLREAFTAGIYASENEGEFEKWYRKRFPVPMPDKETEDEQGARPSKPPPQDSEQLSGSHSQAPSDFK